MIEHRLPFGRYRGCRPQSVPKDYLDWLLRNVRLSTGLRAAVRDELIRRGTDPSRLPPEPTATPPRCRHCDSPRLSLSWQAKAGGGRVVRADCAACKRFVSFVPLTEANVAEADRNIDRTGILRLLTLAEDAGLSVESDGDRLILRPWEKVSPELRGLVHQWGAVAARMMGRTVASEPAREYGGEAGASSVPPAAAKRERKEVHP